MTLVCQIQWPAWQSSDAAGTSCHLVMLLALSVAKHLSSGGVGGVVGAKHAQDC